MNIALLAIFVAVVPASLLAMVMCLAVGVALGPSKIIVRLPIFLAGVVLFATLVSLGESQAGIWPVAFFSVIVTAIAVALRDRVLVMAAIGMIAPLTFGAISFLSADSFSSGSFTATAIAIGLLAVLVSSFRVLGFRVTEITRDTSATDLRLATGRDIREWIGLLDDSGASHGNHAQTMRAMEERGLTPYWQKVIARAYERSLGRLPIERTADGRSLFAVSGPATEGRRGFLAQIRHRFTLRQLLIWSFCAAVVFGFARTLPPLRIPDDAIQMAMPTSIAITIVSLLALHGILSLRVTRQQSQLHILAIAVTALVFPKILGIFPGDPVFFWMMVWLVTSLALWFSAACLVARERGFALVRVGVHDRSRL